MKKVKELVKDTFQCYGCAFKHLAEAMVVWDELQMGYSNSTHIARFVGNMSAAANHLVSKDMILANQIREERMLTFENLSYRPEFEGILANVHHRLQEELAVAEAAAPKVAKPKMTAEEETSDG